MEQIEINGLLEAEKQEIEESIIGEFEKEVKKEEPVKRKTLKKTDLIEKIIEIQKIKGIEQATPAKLKRLRNDELEKMLAEYINETLAPAESENIIHNINSAAEGLFTLHVVVMNISENICGIKGINVLEGLTDVTMERKQELIAVIKEIYEKYPVEINKYLNPVARYIILTSSCVGQCAVKNMLKKKDPPK